MKILRTNSDGMIRLDDSCQPTRLLSDDNCVCVNVRFVFVARFPGGYVYRVRSCRPPRSRPRPHPRHRRSLIVVDVVENSRTIGRLPVNKGRVNLGNVFCHFLVRLPPTARHIFTRRVWLARLRVIRLRQLISRMNNDEVRFVEFTLRYATSMYRPSRSGHVITRLILLRRYTRNFPDYTRLSFIPTSCDARRDIEEWKISDVETRTSRR